jgi:hypothetical protein
VLEWCWSPWRTADLKTIWPVLIRTSADRATYTLDPCYVIERTDRLLILRYLPDEQKATPD